MYLLLWVRNICWSLPEFLVEGAVEEKRRFQSVGSQVDVLITDVIFFSFPSKWLQLSIAAFFRLLAIAHPLAVVARLWLWNICFLVADCRPMRRWHWGELGIVGCDVRRRQGIFSVIFDVGNQFSIRQTNTCERHTGGSRKTRYVNILL